jgi:hypothetical protein
MRLIYLTSTSFIDRYIPGYVFFSSMMESGFLSQSQALKEFSDLYLHLTVYIDDNRNVISSRELGSEELQNGLTL